MQLAALSNEGLLSNLHALIVRGRVDLACLLAYLGEVEERRLDLESACSSLSDFCIRILGMSEDVAARRVAASRLVRRFPAVAGMLERGELHLTALLLLRNHLTDDNHEELLRAASRKTKAEVQEILAARFPRPDVPSLIRALPATTSPPSATPEAAPPPALNSTQVEPLSSERYKMQLTVPAKLKQKLERASNLMRHVNPSGDLAVMLEAALDLLIGKLEKSRLGKVTHPVEKVPSRSTQSGYIRRAVRREVFERDGERCTFVDALGRRCPSRTFLELDHENPRARGGSDDAKNLSVKCARHNALAAERAFGRQHIERKKAERRRRPRWRGEERTRQEQEATALHSPNGTNFKNAADMPRGLKREARGRNHPRRRGNRNRSQHHKHGSRHTSQHHEQGTRDAGQRGRAALRALSSMGFTPNDARRALAIVEKRWNGLAPPLETVVREAIGILT